MLGILVKNMIHAKIGNGIKQNMRIVQCYGKRMQHRRHEFYQYKQQITSGVVYSRIGKAHQLFSPTLIQVDDIKLT